MSVLRPNKPDSSPCRGICSHNVGGDVCTGCGRTVAEVRDWNLYSSEQKIEVKQECLRRLGRQE
jgi:predicted Fe-S protein YdhL (DUF1289 family)